MRGQKRWPRWIVLALMVGALAAFPAMAGGREGDSAAPSPPPSRVVTVHYGDTLWTIARRYCDPRNDVREVVYRIRRANDIDSSELRAGMQIHIPAECLPS